MKNLIAGRHKIFGYLTWLLILTSLNCGPTAEELRQRQILRDRLVDVLLHSPERWNEERRGIEHPPLFDLYLKDAVLRGLNLSGADVTGARFENVRFIECDMSYMKTGATLFKSIKVESSTVQGLNVNRGTLIEDSVFMHSSIRRLYVVGSQGRLENVTFVNCDLSSLELFQSVIRDVTIERSIVRGGGIAILEEVKNLVIKDSDITGLMYRAYNPGADIHIINSHPCDGPWIQFCE